MRGRARLRLLILGAMVCLVAIVGIIAAAMMALVGADLSCGLGGGTAEAAGSGPAPTKTALREIPKHWLAMYREAGSAIDISWPFLASIGYQECGDGTGNCYVVNPSGCAGPMEMAYVRGSECSPDESVPTIWERFRTDGDGDGKTEIFNNADSIFTAAKVLREADGAPPAGGSYAEYREAACNYYGACGDASAAYASEVMARAVSYGFGRPETKTAGVAEAGETAGHGPGTPHPGRGGTEPRGGGRAPVDDRGEATPPESGSVCEGGALFATSSAGGNEIVRIARSQLGEAEHPPGSNCQRYGPCEEWCALFVAWVWERAGVPLNGGPADRAYSGSFWTWAAQYGGRDLPPTATPAPGDAVMYGERLSEMAHVGIVERVFPNGEIETIEGNFGNAVERVGPFKPAEAVAAGEPAPIFGYAEPPTAKGHEGGAEPPKATGGVKRSKR